MREGGEKNGQQRSCQSNGYDSNVYCTRNRVADKNSCSSFGSFLGNICSKYFLFS